MANLKLFSRSKKDPDTLTARSMILPILFCLVCGLLLIFFGNLALRITAYVLAGVMILCGVWSGIVYLRSDPVRRIRSCWLPAPCWLSIPTIWKISCPSSGDWPFSSVVS